MESKKMSIRQKHAVANMQKFGSIHLTYEDLYTEN